MGHRKIKIIILAFSFMFFYSVQAGIDKTGSADIVIYNQGFAVVKEPLTLNLNRGSNSINLTCFPDQIQPDSIILHTAGTGIEVIRQKFTESVNERAALDHYQGETIFFENITQATGERWVREGKVIRAGNDPIVEFEGRLRFGLPGKPLFDSVDNVAPLQSTLSWDLYSQARTKKEVGLSYLSGGISWQANYSVIFEDDSDDLDISGWFLLRNNSGKSFKEASLKLLAGDVGRAHPQPRMAQDAFLAEAAAPGYGGVSMAAIDEYYLYSVKDPVTLKNREMNQVEFLSSLGVGAIRRYVFEAARSDSVSIIMEFKNSKENNLGQPLPGGKIKLYRPKDNLLIFIGEDRISHTAVDETLELNIGSAFDIVAQRKQLDSQRISAREEQESYQITIRNRKSEPIKVEVVERLRYRNWEMVTASEEFERKDVQTIKFILDVPAKAESQVTYSVRLRR